MANEKAMDDLLSESRGAEALDILVDQLNIDKEKTIYNFLSNPGSEDVLWALIHMLSSKATRMASNAAYVLGSLAETELGSHRILSLTQGKTKLRILEDLTQMLTVEDAETVMNAAGTLGTLAEMEEGRQWMLKQSCVEETMTSLTFLLGSENHWTASNSALVLARITISETGSEAILNHPRSKYILTRLIQSLGNDSAGRGMNAAFAIGRLLDTKIGKERLLNCSEAEKMITSLCRMLSKGDMGGAKNACFALSCLATDSVGNQWILANSLFQDVLARLLLLLGNNDDVEAAWFAAMTLKTISTHKQGVLKLRQNSDVEASLLRAKDKPKNSRELNEEIEKTLMHLKKLDQPDPPSVKISGSTSAKIEWNPVNTHTGLQITYKLLCDNKIIYKGQELQRTVDDLRPFTSYSFKVRASTLGDDSPFSEVVTVMTDEGVPTAPTFLRLLGATPTQLRLMWNAPEHSNGVLRGYSVFVGEKLIDTISDTTHIITRLNPATRHSIHVCASTSKGMGERATIEATTEELGAHAPEKPTVTVIGRNEVHVAWMPPTVPLGRFFRYELCMNDRVIYQGTDKVFRVAGLTPDKDYVFAVVAITSEGRCVSEPTKKRTLKDKPQNEPGHHQLKTHSFMAKEFQAMQEKSKSQGNLLPPAQKQKPKLKKKNSNRPSSSVSTSNLSDASALASGPWALSGTSVGGAEERIVEVNDHDFIHGQTKSARKFQNPAILGGASIKKKTPPHPVSANKIQNSAQMNSHNLRGLQANGATSRQHLSGHESQSGRKAEQDLVPPKQIEEKLVQTYPNEFSFNKENSRQSKIMSTTARHRARLHRGHVIMKGKKVLKSDKELLAEIAATSQREKTGSKQHKPPETGFGQRPYYPDIVSTIRKPKGPERYLESDFLNGTLGRNSSSSPDSLNAEPGTSRPDDLTFNPNPEIPPIKSAFSRHLIRERHINEYQVHDYRQQNTYPVRSLQSYSVPKASTRSTNVYDQVILKSTPTSKFGLKYTQGHAAETAESSVENDSAFQSLSTIQDSNEAHSLRSSVQRPMYLLKPDALSKSSSERHLNREIPETRALPSRLKTPPKGYWSDHDIIPPRGRKKAPLLTPINYRKFQGAHRPTKSIRLESPFVTNSDTGTWFVGDSIPGGDNNRYKFIPTQWRTQPANLPSHTTSGRLNYRLDSLNDANRSRLEVHDQNARAPSSISGGHTPIPPTRKHQTRKSNHRRLPKSTNDVLNYEPHSKLNEAYHKPHIYPGSKEDPAYSVQHLKTGSTLASLNYHHGYEVTTSLPSFHVTRSPSNATKLPGATSATIPRTVLSPLTPSDMSPSGSKLSRSLTESPRLRMPSTCSSFYGSSIPTASGYAVSPSNSLSPLLSNDKNMAQMRQVALVPGGGDAV